MRPGIFLPFPDYYNYNSGVRGLYMRNTSGPLRKQ